MSARMFSNIKDVSHVTEANISMLHRMAMDLAVVLIWLIRTMGMGAISVYPCSR